MSKYYNQDILYYIDALLKYSNYGKAAKSLYISQPYLTQVIKRIEHQLNCELINRSKLPYRLTEQGKIYYQYLTSVENNYARLIRDLSSAADDDSTVLRIGVLPSLGTYLLPLFLPKFMGKHPNCKIELSEHIPEKNEKLVLNGELDFWIGQNSRNLSPSLNAITWGRHRYFAIIPRSSDLYQKGVAMIPEGTIEISRLLTQKLILTSKGSAIRKQIDQLLSVFKVEPNIIIESTEINTVQKLSMNNMGVTFIPESILIQASPLEYNIYQVPLEELNLDYFISYHRERALSELDNDLLEAFQKNGQSESIPGDEHE